MQLPRQHADRVQELCDLYNTAEADLKNVGRVQNELIVTGVNQLRYAGQHLIRALASQEDDDSVRENLDAAIRHAQRAIYDVNDSAIQYYIQRYRQFRETFPRADLASVIGDTYHDAVRAFNDAERHVQITQESQADRHSFYKEARTHVERLKEAVESIESYRDDVIRDVKRNNRQRTVTWVSLGLNLLVVLAVIARLAWALISGGGSPAS